MYSLPIVHRGCDMLLVVRKITVTGDVANSVISRGCEYECVPPGSGLQDHFRARSVRLLVMV